MKIEATPAIGVIAILLAIVILLWVPSPVVNSSENLSESTPSIEVETPTSEAQ